MKRLALLTAAIFAGVSAAKAATVETMSAELEKAGFTVQVGGHQPQPPKPGVPHPAHQPQQPQHPGQPNHPQNPGQPHQPPQVHPTHPTHPAYPPVVNPGHPTHPTYPPVINPGHPTHPTYPPVTPNHPVYPPVNPGHPTYPPVYPPVYPGHPTNPGYPPYYPPTEQMQQFRFESSSFVFGSDARQSLENAAAALQRAGHIVLEKRNNFNSYTLVFRAPSSLKVQKYVSGNFVFGSEAQRAAEEFVLAMQGQGKVVLEKNVSANTFTVSYLTSVHSGYTQQQTYRSGNFVFGSDAARSMTETVTALQGMGAVVLEKRLEATSYTIVYQYSYKLETQNYASGNFIFGSDAARSMTETAEALKRVNGLVVLEKRLAGTSYNIVFFAPYSLQPQKYVSGNYTFGSDAQRAAAETAAALASQGMIILEKNVAGTQFTITYIYGGSQYPY